MNVLWQIINYYKYQVGAIGVVLIALFLFCGYRSIQSKEKEETIQTLKQWSESGVKEAQRPQTSPSTQSEPLTQEGTGRSAAHEGKSNQGINNVLSTGERPSAEAIKAAQKNASAVREEIVGILRIPSIRLEMPILLGDSFENMLVGACTVLPHQVMGKGNYALAAHNAGVDGVMFSSLGNVAVGETITLQDRSRHVYSYTVKEKRHVDKTDTRVLDGTEKPTITLITCDQATETAGRIVVIAE